jgi:choline kinase
VKAIILSAGQGRRLLPLTEQLPKCCLQLDDRSLLEWQIESLIVNGVTEVVVVTGFGAQYVEDVISRIKHIPVRTRYNPFYALSDNLGTCWVVRDEMSQPFVLINGDTLFEPRVMSRLLTRQSAFAITLATDHKADYDDDDMKIVAQKDRLQRVGKRLEMNSVNGESIGMMKFDQAGCRAFVNKIEQLMSGTDGLTRWYLSAIDELAQQGLVGISPISGLNWCEVDDIDDLEHAAKVVRLWSDQIKQQRPSDQGSVLPDSDISSPYSH